MKVAVLEGDGVGPEVMGAALTVLERVAQLYQLPLSLERADVGGAAIDKHGCALPASTLAVCDRSEAILFGSVGGPQWASLPLSEQPESAALLPLRKRYQLFANIRPVKLYPQLAAGSPLRPERACADFVVFRELTSGLYFGQPKGVAQDGKSAVDTLKYEVHEIERITRLACEAARLRDGKVCSVDKANVLATGLLWRNTVSRIVEEEYPELELSHLYVDNASMQLILNPGQFSVILTENTFGDILSDEAAALVGSIGLLASASVNQGRFGLYEPIHGTGLYPPAIAGKGIANPIAQIVSVAMMLRYSFGQERAAEAIERAVDKVLDQGYRTLDIALNNEVTAGTQQFGQRIADAVDGRVCSGPCV